MNRTIRLLATAVAVAGIAACSSPEVAPVPAADVAEEVADRFEEETGSRPAVTCPDDLPAEVGTEMVCEFVAGNPPQEFEVLLTVTSVGSDGTVLFDIEDRPKETPTPREDPSADPTEEESADPAEEESTA
nr:DUF4333 domain-containing protein [Actinomycetales bacterium]